MERIQRYYGTDHPHPPEKLKYDGTYTFDKVTNVYNGGVIHEENQPAHLLINNTDICNTRCVKEFGNPCQNFCPANVYEMVDDPTQAEGYTEADLAEWAGKIQALGRAWRDTFVYFKHEEAGIGPAFARQLEALLPR